MKPVSIIIGGLVVILGLLEIKKLFWDKAEFSLQIPSKHAKPIQEYIKKISIRSAIILGAFVAIVEIPLTGGPYLLITTLLATQGLSWGVFGLLALYNFIFVLPLLILLVGVYYGLKIVSVQQFKNKNRQWMRLAIGLIMITLGVVSMLWSLNIMRLTLS